MSVNVLITFKNTTQLTTIPKAKKANDFNKNKKAALKNNLNIFLFGFSILPGGPV